MSRATSLNWEIDFEGQIVEPLTIGEFSEGDEERIDVADGSRKYKISSQIYNVDEVPFTILIRENRYEYDICQSYMKSGQTQDIFVIGRDATGTAKMTFIFYNCGVANGKKSSFDRNGKTVDTKGYFLVPENVEEVI